MAVHVDLAGDVDDAVGAEGEFQPGVADLAVDHLRVRVDGGAGAADAGGVGEGGRGAGGQGVGHQRLDGVDPAALGTPADQDDVLSRGIGEGVGVLSVFTDPDLVVVGEGVQAERLEGQGAQEHGAVGRAEAVRDDVVLSGTEGWSGERMLVVTSPCEL